MNHMHERLIGVIFLVTLLAGCPQVNEIRSQVDGAVSVDELLSQHEYARVRQLTSHQPELDSPDLQTRIAVLENDYEKQVLTEAGAMQTQGNLHGAVQLLSMALSRVPHSAGMRDLRNRLEHERVTQLEVNQQQALLARARYLAEQQILFRENIKLAPADTRQQRKQEAVEQEAIQVADALRVYTEKAMARDDLAAARTCLAMSRELHETTDAVVLDTRLGAIEKSLQQTTQKRANIKRARSKRKQDRDDVEKTGKLLAELRSALAAGRLQDAQLALSRIPANRQGDDEVKAARNELTLAVNARVDTLVLKGDSLYRADQISEALELW